MRRNWLYRSVPAALVVISLAQPSSAQPSAAIVQNFPDPEIDRLQEYLDDLGIAAQVFDRGLEFNDIADFDLLIWDDVGFQNEGLTDNEVLVFEQAFAAGIPLYLIGDDLAFSHKNLSDQVIPIWTELLHLNPGDNFGGGGTVNIVKPSHPLTDGPFGIVPDFTYTEDIDSAMRTKTGEVLLAQSNGWDALLAFENGDTGIRSVTQNFQVTNHPPQSEAPREILFKNAVMWLLTPPCPWDLDGNIVVGVSDLLSLLASWGPCKGCPADFDGNDDVGVSDLLALLVNWGPCP